MTTEIDTQIPLQKVAERYGISPDVLTRLAQDGIIRVERNGKNGEEERAVSVSTIAAAANVVRQEIKPEQYKHLHGKRIRLMEASREYDVEHSNLLRWADRGYIQIVDQDKLRMELDRAGVAYVSALFKRAIELTESPIRAGWVLKRLLA